MDRRERNRSRRLGPAGAWTGVGFTGQGEMPYGKSVWIMLRDTPRGLPKIRGQVDFHATWRPTVHPLQLKRLASVISFI